MSDTAIWTILGLWFAVIVFTYWLARRSNKRKVFNSKKFTRTCKVCGKTKPLSHFDPIKVGGVIRTRTVCRECLKEQR